MELFQYNYGLFGTKTTFVVEVEVLGVHYDEEQQRSTMSGEEIIYTTYKHMEVTGKMASVQKCFFLNKLVLNVKEMQINEKNNHEVTVYHLKRDSKSVGLAFSFLHNKQRVFSVVDGDELKLEMKPDVKTACSDENCLFQWHEKTGEWGILKSVAEPQKYLCIVNNKVTIGPEEKKGTFRLTSK